MHGERIWRCTSGIPGLHGHRGRSPSLRGGFFLVQIFPLTRIPAAWGFIGLAEGRFPLLPLDWRLGPRRCTFTL